MAYAKIAAGLVREWAMNAQGLKLAESEREDLAIMIQKALVEAAKATRETAADMVKRLWVNEVMGRPEKNYLYAGLDRGYRSAEEAIRALPLPGDE